MAAAEQKKSYQVIKQFEGLNTKANRTAIKETEFSWIENVMPVGFGNLKVTPTYTLLGYPFGSNVVNLFSCSLSGKDYVITVGADGSMEYVDVTTLPVTSHGIIAGAGTFTADGTVKVSEWRNKYLTIIDPVKGYFLWDGTNFAIPVGSVGRVGITNYGSGYTSAPTITFSAPPAGGNTATAICSITSTAGQVNGFSISSGGSGFTSPPLIDIASPPAPGIKATAVASISGSGTLNNISIINPGSGYTSPPSVTITPTNGAAATSSIDKGSITAIALTNAGSGYTSPPTVTISGGGGSGGSAIAELVTFATGTITVSVTNGGSGYTTSGNVTVTVGDGTGWTTRATGTAIVSGGQVTQVIMTNHGEGYTNSSNVVVTITDSGTGFGATANSILSSDLNCGIASFSGRMWIAAGRNVYYSAASSPTDFTSVSAGEITLQDSTLHANITQLLSANNFLYIFGDESINVFSDVRVTSTGTTLFTNTNISASVGSKRPYAIFPYFRSVMFMNEYGVYALVGSTTTKVSDALDGLFQYIDFTQPVYGGQVLINNILCAAFNFYCTSSPTGAGWKQAVFFEKKWFITSLVTSSGSIQTFVNSSYITSAPVGGKILLFAANQKALYQLYADAVTPTYSYVQTALMPMGDPIRTKQALKFGIEATNVSGELDVTVDSEAGSSPSTALTLPAINWINDSLQVVQWQNNSSATVLWGGGSPYFLYKGDARQWGKYLGLTISTTQNGAVFNTMEFEHELRTRF